jgi:hypothetical protein
LPAHTKAFLALGYTCESLWSGAFPLPAFHLRDIFTPQSKADYQKLLPIFAQREKPPWLTARGLTKGSHDTVFHRSGTLAQLYYRQVYLKPTAGIFVITKAGKDLLASKPKKILSKKIKIL